MNPEQEMHGITSHLHADNRKKIASFVIILILLVGVAWFVYKTYFTPRTFESYKSSVIEQIAKDSPAVSDETKMMILEAMVEENSANNQ